MENGNIDSGSATLLSLSAVFTAGAGALVFNHFWWAVVCAAVVVVLIVAREYIKK